MLGGVLYRAISAKRRKYILEKCYVVTVHPDGHSSVSLYKITCSETTGAEVTKIALQGESKVQVGGTLGGGRMVGIGSSTGQLQRFDRVGNQKVDEVNTIHWGGHTGLIAGMFLDEDEARKCFDTPNLKFWDVRFHHSSEETIERIGGYHPFISFTKLFEDAIALGEIDRALTGLNERSPI